MRRLYDEETNTLVYVSFASRLDKARARATVGLGLGYCRLRRHHKQGLRLSCDSQVYPEPPLTLALTLTLGGRRQQEPVQVGHLRAQGGPEVPLITSRPRRLPGSSHVAAPRRESRFASEGLSGIHHSD